MGFCHHRRLGSKVVIADINQTAAEETAQQFMAGYIAVDVTAELQVQAGIDKALVTYDGIDILVSNA